MRIDPEAGYNVVSAISEASPGSASQGHGDISRVGEGALPAAARHGSRLASRDWRPRSRQTRTTPTTRRTRSRSTCEPTSTTRTSPRRRAGQDGVDYFLFDVKEGYCDYYASAMVVMLRSVGVPARFVVGYTPGQLKPTNEQNDEGDQYRILERNAHAWPEVYFPSYGWVQFEPTASEPLLARPADPADNLDAGLVPDVGTLNPEMEPPLPEPQPLDVATPVAAPSAFETWLRGNWGWLAAMAALTAAAVGAWRYLRWRQIDLFRDSGGAFAALRAARPVGNEAAYPLAVEPDAAGKGRGVQRKPARSRACRRYDRESVHRSAVRAPAAAGREHHRPRPRVATTATAVVEALAGRPGPQAGR